MDSFEVTVDDEVFRIDERKGPGGALSYDFSWVSGPADGTYGFSVGRLCHESGGMTSEKESRMTRDELVDEVRAFVGHVYDPGGIGEAWPDHIPARDRRSPRVDW
ncbi:hypothetical protein [uncultured Arthrobacter sp.]|uniref:hypothetical protein n=1 Tax=uncultured Arthrobacter sp. TaxID=114050 RepID=UPI002619F9D0|nr:hypothetical protein [uncultured Arthrobacter sp.]